MEDIILVGYGGHAKSVADCIERQNEYRIIGYTDIEAHESRYNYLGTDEVLQEYYEQGIRNAFVCIGYLGKGELREEIYVLLKKLGYFLPIIRDSSSIISETAEVDEGVFIGKGAIINAGAKIGKMSIINTMALVEHECIVDEFTHVAVGAILCGQVRVGKAAFIGANATVIQEKVIFPRQIVPAGVVIR